MGRNQKTAKEELGKEKSRFIKVIEACDKIFDGEAFLLPEDDKGNRRISIALYDAIALATSYLSNALL